jgi:hypothetical protein
MARGETGLPPINGRAASGDTTPRRVQCGKVFGLPVVDRFTEPDVLSIGVDEQRATELGGVGLNGLQVHGGL